MSGTEDATRRAEDTMVALDAIMKARAKLTAMLARTDVDQDKWPPRVGKPVKREWLPDDAYRYVHGLPAADELERKPAAKWRSKGKRR